MANGPNEVLASLLDELGWSPRVLARRINQVFGVGTVADTAPYHWRDNGCIPRPPLPELAAWVLSRELGRPVTTAELWKGRASGSPLVLPADIDMNGPWSRVSTLGLLEDWVVAGLLDRRHFLAVSSTTILDIATRYLMGEPGLLAAALERGSVGNPLLVQIEQSIPLLYRLNDTYGGGAYLPYVGAQFRAVALLLRQGGHPAEVERRLFAALATIGQLAGWMALDAGQHGLAQRYLFTALRAAREADYHLMAADLAIQAAAWEHSRDAIALGQAAVRIAAGSPAGVRALVQNRLAYGHAAGQLDDFERTYATGLDAIANRDPAEEQGAMNYLTANHLDNRPGYALTHAGTLAAAAGDHKTGIAPWRAVASHRRACPTSGPPRPASGAVRGSLAVRRHRRAGAALGTEFFFDDEVNTWHYRVPALHINGARLLTVVLNDDDLRERPARVPGRDRICAGG